MKPPDFWVSTAECLFRSVPLLFLLRRGGGIDQRGSASSKGRRDAADAAAAAVFFLMKRRPGRWRDQERGLKVTIATARRKKTNKKEHFKQS